MSQVIRGMAAGLLAGCAASWAMNAFARAKPIHPMPRHNGRPADGGAGSAFKPRPSQQREVQREDASVATAQALSRNIFDHELSDCEKKIAGPAVHYAYGSLVGALYGGIAELLPVTAAGLGMPFGIALWLLGDEIAVPALGLGKSPGETTAEVHADALAAHLAYGVTTDLLRRVLKHVI